MLWRARMGAAGEGDDPQRAAARPRCLEVIRWSGSAEDVAIVLGQAIRQALKDMCALIPLNEEAFAWGIKAVQQVEVA